MPKCLKFLVICICFYPPTGIFLKNSLLDHTWLFCSADGEFGNPAEEVSEALTMTTYLDMLNDTTRNRAYHLAIQKAVKGARHVLDIGYTL